MFARSYSLLIASLKRMSRLQLLAVVLAVFASPMVASALPWDVDMFTQDSYKANEMARAPAEGTIPVGKDRFDMTIDEADTKLKNPVEFSFDSVWRGRRLWSVNCGTCHGEKGDGKGPVGVQMGVPDLLTGFFKTGRTDGRIFGVVHLGQGNMPGHGYKFSAAEIWDVVNYLRFLQGRDVAGLERPAS